MAGNVLFQKLAKITGEISRVPKRGRNEFHKYDYVTEADLLDAVRAKLAENQVAYFFSVTNVTTRPTDNAKNGPVTEVTVAVTFADGETGEVFTVLGAGAGQDASDKGVYKAITGAQKYTLMKTFLIPTGDDPELDDAPAVKKPASGGKGAGKAKPTEEAQPAQAVGSEGKNPLDVEGGEAKIPSGKLQGRTVNSLSVSEAEDLLGKLPKNGNWYKLIDLRLKSLKAAAADPALAEAAAIFGAVAVK